MFPLPLPKGHLPKFLDLSQELRELGARGTLFRVQWELRGRIRPVLHTDTELHPSFGRYATAEGDLGWPRHLPLADAPSVAAAVPLPQPERDRLARLADDAVRGRIIAFGRWPAEYGSPVQWNLNPVTGRGWESGVNLTRQIGEASLIGDVKFTWEVGRFPHAYQVARAASYMPHAADQWATALLEQMRHFTASNPAATGVHWTSGQEVAFRLLAWLFALDVLFTRTRLAKPATAFVADALITGATYIEKHLDYARIAVYNNHLLSEALALFATGALLPDAPNASRWRQLGRKTLDDEAGRQFYEDGGYIQQSHNYQRVALQDLLWACAFAKSMGDRPSSSWLRAMERSLDFLIAHQNPHDGRLPNYGPNDGSHPSPLSSCDFLDFRPTLQAVSLITRGERAYEPGPWDEEAAWFLGAKALDAPVRKAKRASASFPVTGDHVLRSLDESSFGTLRCGSLRDRFSQIDMLHLDVWWRGQNVLVDAGSYSYNGAPEWHNHFTRTGCHNTIELDGRDQMLHFRQFKVLYWTKAELLRFDDNDRWCVAEGEHYGYRRHRGKCVHRRSVLFLKDDVWVVVDRISGTGDHTARLHWLGGDYPWAQTANGMSLVTPEGPFTVEVIDAAGLPMHCGVVAGQDNPPRGWLSRYYGEKVPVPSLAVNAVGQVPLTFISVLAGTKYKVAAEGSRWKLTTAQVEASFQIEDGRFTNIAVA